MGPSIKNVITKGEEGSADGLGGARRNRTHVVRVWVRGSEKLCFVVTSFMLYLTNLKQCIKTEDTTQRINLKNSKIIRIRISTRRVTLTITL